MKINTYIDQDQIFDFSASSQVEGSKLALYFCFGAHVDNFADTRPPFKLAQTSTPVNQCLSAIVVRIPFIQPTCCFALVPANDY